MHTGMSTKIKSTSKPIIEIASDPIITKNLQKKRVRDTESEQQSAEKKTQAIQNDYIRFKRIETNDVKHGKHYYSTDN